MNLKDILSQHPITYGEWESSIVCHRVSAKDARTGLQRANGLSIYSVLLVLSGHLELEYNGSPQTFVVGDLHLYAPGMPTAITAISDDYIGYLLMIDERLVAEQATLSYFLRTAYRPIAENNAPKIKLTAEQSSRLIQLFDTLALHIELEFFHKQEALVSLCTVIGINLMSMLELNINRQRIGGREEEVFAQFLQLIPTYAIEQHNIAFYAHRLNVSSTYLSRIVRRISDRTVKSFIEYNITSEAIRLLKSTKLSINEIAWELNYADQSSFTKFFTRRLGISPLQYRRQNT